MGRGGVGIVGLVGRESGMCVRVSVDGHYSCLKRDSSMNANSVMCS